MRALAIFLVGVVIVFGSLALVITATPEEESRIFVVVDSSFPMREVWSRVPGALDELEAEGHTEFALATEKKLIHSWQEQLRFRDQTPFAPCDLSEIGDHAEVADADVLVLITTSAACPTEAFPRWRVVTLDG